VDNKIQTVASDPNSPLPMLGEIPGHLYGIFAKKSGDPSRTYVYFTTDNGQTYYLYANLERGAYDKEACNKGEVCESISDNGIENVCGGKKL